MKVLELALFVGAFRSPRPLSLDELRDTVAVWFECPVEADLAANRIANMVACRWLVPDGSRLKATEDGRRAVGQLMNGLVRMPDQGTRMLDVALMMAVLRLCKGELDDGVATH